MIYTQCCRVARIVNDSTDPKNSLVTLAIVHVEVTIIGATQNLSAVVREHQREHAKPSHTRA